jgi:hypothetical protein
MTHEAMTFDGTPPFLVTPVCEKGMASFGHDPKHLRPLRIEQADPSGAHLHWKV